MSAANTDPHTSDAALRRLYREAAALLRDLENTANGAEGMTLAARFVGVLNDHIEPLRNAIGDVEFYDEAERIVHAIGSLSGITGREAIADTECGHCRKLFHNGDTCRFGGCPMGGDF